ncbi:HesA/MoeB/ThiF family protein [Lactococcus termiticola]|uniref:Molybdopterin/thiamine biosynthesis adenylyltransferase n=1 Tax=Lactococcus termiticola TaxID=2169526 RepID=A0A2R5HJY3_9LACT|nr:HesA/MoeB/ThiF family protein [Lactococcus termiticola]GBG96721.1 molybdopterin/thiamine biosynthesis adenylyltransferase [Lactococcus termiticola]
MTYNNERFDRQVRVGRIGQDGQEKLSSSHVLIIGAGGLGSNVAEQLTRAGIGRISLFDDDRIELSNLQRQSLYKNSDLDRLKVEASKEALLAINPDLTIDVYSEKFEAEHFENFSEVDLVLDCTDNFLARQAINDFCLYYHLPFVFASAAGTNGQVMAIKPGQNSPCLSCVFPDLLELEKDCETLGVITPLLPLIASLEVSLAFQILIEPEKVDWESLHIVDAWRLSIDKFKVKKRDNCEACQVQSQNNKVKFDKSCGGVYQAIFSSFDNDKWLAYCESQDWPLKRNPIASRISIDEERSITAFRTGRLLFYQFEENDAKALLEGVIANV